jgi:hypothetical protein
MGYSEKKGLSLTHGLRHNFTHKIYKDQTGSTAWAVEGRKIDVNPCSVVCLYQTNWDIQETLLHRLME